MRLIEACLLKAPLMDDDYGARADSARVFGAFPVRADK